MSGGFSCWRCGIQLQDAELPVSRHSSCRSCFEPLRCCRMCRHFSEQAEGQCLHDEAEPPEEKERSNFCDFFRPGKAGFDPTRNRGTERAKNRLKSLFADAEEEAEEENDPVAEESPPDPVRSRLDNLFDS